eukprot:7463428-Lingulodinium_polyedra.AAC.1
MASTAWGGSAAHVQQPTTRFRTTGNRSRARSRAGWTAIATSRQQRRVVTESPAARTAAKRK